MAVPLVFALLFTLQSGVLGQEGFYGLLDPNGQVLWTDGEQFDKKINVWQPALPTSDWRFLGQVVQGNYDKCAQRLFRFRSDPRSSTADMVRPEGFVWIWDDRLSYASKDVSVWRMTCPPGYVALSDFFYDQNRVTNPVGLFDRSACVRAALTEPCPLGDKLWDDEGSGASYDVGVWGVKAAANHVAGYFFANRNQNDPPKVQPHCLKKTSFIQL